MPVELVRKDVNAGEVLDLVHILMGALGKDPTISVHEGAAACLAAFLILASPRPLPPLILMDLMEECSGLLGIQINEALEKLGVQDEASPRLMAQVVAETQGKPGN